MAKRSYLDFRVVDGRLVVVPLRFGRCVSLRLGSESADVVFGDDAPVVLPWDAYGNIRSRLDGAALDGWAITHFGAGQGGVFGIALQVSGIYDAASSSMISHTMTWWRRASNWNPLWAAQGHALPILPTTTLFTPTKRERDTLSALAAVLALRPELRVALADRERMTQLARDLSGGLLPNPVERTGARRDTVDIIIALHRLGFVHQFGRPLESETHAPLNEIVSKVGAALDGNPFRKGLTVSDETISAAVRRYYVDVAPWPFAALLPP